MTSKVYQRKYLRAPFRETVLYSDDGWVQKATTLNISEGGLLIDQLPNFPSRDYVSMLVSIPQLPPLRNFSLLKMQTYSKELFDRQVVRAKARMVRREQLAQNLDNIFRSRFGLEFLYVLPSDQKIIDDYVTTFSSNLIYLQTLIDSYNTDEETRALTRVLAGIMGYGEFEKISNLRTIVGDDYRSLQWS